MLVAHQQHQSDVMCQLDCPHQDHEAITGCTAGKAKWKYLHVHDEREEVEKEEQWQSVNKKIVQGEIRTYLDIMMVNKAQGMPAPT